MVFKSHTDLTDLTDFYSLRSSSIERPNENPRCLQRRESVGSVSDLEVGAALHAEGAEDGGEDSDDEIDDGFPVYFHGD